MRHRSNPACASLTLLISASLVAATASAKEPLRLEPSSKWQVDYGEQACRLARQFGTGDKSILFVLAKFGPGNDVKLTLSGKPLAPFAGEALGKLRFGPELDWQPLNYFSGKMGKDVLAIISRGSTWIVPPSEAIRSAWEKGEPSEPPHVTPAELAAIRYVAVGLRRTTVIELATGPLTKGFAEMDKCLDGLVRHWGFDPAVMESLRSGPTPANRPATWMSNADYPSKMIFEGRRAVVNFLLNIDDKGAVTSCQIQQSTRPVDFDKVVCERMMKRAKFNPAIGAGGKPVAAFWRNTVIFITG